MNKQFAIINQQLKNISEEVHQSKRINENVLEAFYIISSAISIDVIMSNLRRTQDTLIDTVTNIYYGRLDVHLLSPEQIQEQLNIISGQLQEDLMIPAKDIKDLYSLLHIQARVTKKYLIMEIRLPLLNHDHFELDCAISIPQKQGDRTIYTIAQTKYVAVNVRKDTLMPMTEYDLQSCIKQSDVKLLCPLNSPIYNIKSHDSICDTRVSINDKNLKFCKTETLSCINKWIKLHARDSWLYSCCEECVIRIMCPAGVTTKRLRGSGVIALGRGCVVKGDTFTIHAHYDFVDQMFIQQTAESARPFITSPINDIINSSIPKDILTIEDHAQLYEDIKQKLETLKSQSSIEFPDDNIPHHIINYSISSLMITVILLLAVYKVKQRCQRRPRTRGPREEAAIEMTCRPRHGVSQCSVIDEVVSNRKVASRVQCGSVNEVVPNRKVASPVKCSELSKSVTSLAASAVTFD
ncbi:hypothetical protein JYU34_007855 [Plutella xylostella]|uniref:Envelope protein n=1 Tax=Plutella xylostella TaxID=51655 RepID=A0ABQ7QRI6_PLUXY|nr:hypothetical protein JYU34_007855 [Plutella xylostella]